MVKSIAVALLTGVLIVSAGPPDTVWTLTLGGRSTDEGWSVAETHDEGYIILGNSYSFGAGLRDAYLIRVDKQGETLWTRTFGDTRQDYGYCVHQTADHGFVLAGKTESGGREHDVLLVRTDSAGATAWSKVYGRWTGDEAAIAVCETHDHGLAAAGYTATIGAGGRDIWLLRLAADGETLWTRTYGGAEHDAGYAVEETEDRGFLITGDTRSFGAGGSDAYQVRTDSLGTELWARTYGWEGEDHGRSACGETIAGFTNSRGAGSFDFLLAGPGLARTYGGRNADSGYSLTRLPDGGFAILGNTESYGNGVDYRPDLYLVRTDAQGDTLWTATYGDTWYDYGRSVAATRDGGLIAAGFMDMDRGCQTFDVYLVRLVPEVGVGKQYPCSLAAVPPSIVRGSIRLPEDSRAVLFDIAGRQVVSLEPGLNNLRHLDPGVYCIVVEEGTARRLVVVK